MTSPSFLELKGKDGKISAFRVSVVFVVVSVVAGLIKAFLPIEVALTTLLLIAIALFAGQVIVNRRAHRRGDDKTGDETP